MPFRRRTFRNRRPRRKTRWLAITPGGQTFTTTPNTVFHQLVPKDASGSVGIQEFYGGTLSKVILDITTDPTPFNNDPTSANQFRGNVYAGLFVTEDTSPDPVIWTPNEPSGDYMIRDTIDYWYRREQDVDGHGIIHMGYNIPHLMLETHVSRKLKENSRLFLGMYFAAIGTGYSNFALGWTGRMLITLP